ncbi:MAG: glyoxalase superfamily protein, partial [Phycicoccus sp.]
VPVLRVQHAADALVFYVDYLGFTVQWEHRFAPDLPLYLRLSRDDTQVDLSEHHGDGTPGTVIWIPIADAKKFLSELRAKTYTRARPSIDRAAPGGPTIELTDPSGNVIRLCQPQ